MSCTACAAVAASPLSGACVTGCRACLVRRIARGASLATRAALVRIAMRAVLAPDREDVDRAELLVAAGARIAGQRAGD